MTKRSPIDHAASARERLLQHAKQQRLDFQRVLTLYGIERLLARLCRTPDARDYTLKGAMLFATWDGFAMRPTKDVDLLGHGDPHPEAIRALFAQACEVQIPEDGIVFAPETIDVVAVREDELYEGVRVTVVGTLASARIRVQVDLGFGDHVHPPPIRAALPGLLPGLPPPELPVYPPETVIAEKFEAMLRFGLRNSRLKDFYDLWALSRFFDFDLGTLLRAVDGTLRRRATVIPAGPVIGLTEEFAAVVLAAGYWTAFLKNQPPPELPPPFPEVQTALRRFLEPVLEARALPEAAQRRRWDRAAGAWRGMEE